MIGEAGLLESGFKTTRTTPIEYLIKYPIDIQHFTIPTYKRDGILDLAAGIMQ